MSNVLCFTNVISELTCSSCEKFLSVIPVKVYNDKSIKCGRCTGENDDGFESLYNDLIPNMYFNCVNHYEGCGVLLKPDQVLAHEENCTSSTFNCPICEDVQLPVYQLLIHFKKHHHRQVINKPKLKLTFTDDEQYFLYCEKSTAFIISVHFDKIRELIFLNCMILRATNSTLIKYQFFVFNKDEIHSDSMWYVCSGEFKNEKRFTTQISLSEDLFYSVKVQFMGLDSTFFQFPHNTSDGNDTDIIPTSLTRIIYLSDEFKQTYNTWKLSPNKRAVINGSSFVTFQGFCFPCQYIMADMEFKSKQLCKNCNSDLMRKVHSTLQFFCKWKCREYFPCNILLSHELHCNKRPPIKCPIKNCTKLSAIIYNLQDHFAVIHKDCHFIFSKNICLNVNDFIFDQDYFVFFDDVILNLLVEESWNKKICISLWDIIYESTIYNCNVLFYDSDLHKIKINQEKSVPINTKLICKLTPKIHK